MMITGEQSRGGEIEKDHCKSMNVLFVDDEEYTLDSLRRILHREKFGTFFALSGTEALRIMERVEINVIVTDMRMPGMDGLALLTEIKERYPDTVRIALSACTMTGQLLPCINTGHLFKFITKPLEPVDLKESLRQAFQYCSLRLENKVLVEQLTRQNQKLKKSLAERIAMEQKHRDMAMIDPLTGLYNRRHLQSALRREWQLWKRHEIDCACLMIDLDHFKAVNDTYGHAAGDTVLQTFSHRLRKSVRQVDICCRYGGEEFVVLLPDSTLGEAISAGERILEESRIETEIEGGATVVVTASIGVSSLSECNARGWSDLINRADANLLCAKQAGRNRMIYQRA